MLLGLFAIPAYLLWVGHHWRKRSQRAKGAFWGGVVGHTIGAVLATVAAMYEAALWSDDDLLRGVLGFWLMFALGIAGIAIGASLGARSRTSSDTQARNRS
jgi:hypothetical protein